MQTAQERIISAIEEKVTAKGYVPAIVKDYSNVGTIYLYKPDDSTAPSVGEIGFDFQGNSYKLCITVNGDRIPSQFGRNDYFDFYQKYSQPTAFWNALATSLPTLKRKVKAA